MGYGRLGENPARCGDWRGSGILTTVEPGYRRLPECPRYQRASRSQPVMRTGARLGVSNLPGAKLLDEVAQPGIRLVGYFADMPIA